MSRLSLKADTRVTSAANASAWRSYMSLTCSSQESGTPTGAVGSSLSRPRDALYSSMFLNPPLDFPDIVQVVVEPSPIYRIQVGAQPSDILGNSVENAPVDPSPGRPVLGRARPSRIAPRMRGAGPASWEAASWATTRRSCPYKRSCSDSRRCRKSRGSRCSAGSTAAVVSCPSSCA